VGGHRKRRQSTGGGGGEGGAISRPGGGRRTGRRRRTGDSHRRAGQRRPGQRSLHEVLVKGGKEASGVGRGDQVALITGRGGGLCGCLNQI
jgi:hypothetical protein